MWRQPACKIITDLIQSLSQHLAHKLKEGEMVLLNVTGGGGIKVATTVDLRNKY